MPTPWFICGAETGIVAVGAAPGSGITRYWDALSGTMAEDTTTKNNGLRSYKFGTASGYIGKNIPAGNRAFILSIYVYPTTGTIPNKFIQINSSANAVIDIASGNWRAAVGANQVSGPAVTLNAWTRIDLYYNTSTTTGTLKWQVNGSAQTDVTNTITAADITVFYFGKMTSTGTDYWYVDDVVASLNSADYPLGAHKVVGLPPNVDGTHSFASGDFKYNNTTNIDPAATDVNTYLDNVPLTDILDYISQNVAGTKYVEIGFANPSDSIDAWGVEVAVSFHASGTGANDLYLKVNDGGTINDTMGGDVSNTTITYGSKQLATAPSGGAWTQAKLNAVKARIGYSTDVNAVPFIDAVMIEVAYPVGGSYQEVLTSLAISASTVAALQTFVNIVSDSISSLDSVTDIQSYVQTLIDNLSGMSVVSDIQSYLTTLNSVVQSSSSLTAIQTYVESLQSLAVSSSSITEFKAFVETVQSIIVSASTLTDLQSMIEALLSTASSASSVTDLQSYLAALQSVGVSASTIQDFKTYIEILQSTIVSSASISDAVVRLEILQSVAQSASSLTDIQSYVQSLASTGNSISSAAALQSYVNSLQSIAISTGSIADIQTYLETLQTVGISGASVADQKTFFESVQTVIHSISSVTEIRSMVENLLTLAQGHASLSDLQSYIQTLLTTIQSGSSVVDIMSSEYVENLLTIIVSQAGVYDYYEKPGMIETTAPFYFESKPGFEFENSPPEFRMEDAPGFFFEERKYS